MKHFLWFFGFLLAITACNKKTPCEKEIYLLPDGFHGPVIVYFDQADGDKIQYEDGNRIYHIPSSGYLKSQFPKNGGCMDGGRINFFYKDSLNEVKPVDYFLNLAPEDYPADRDYVLFTFLSDKTAKPDYVIHLIGGAHEFNELTQSVHQIDPVKLLDSLSNQ